MAKKIKKCPSCGHENDALADYCAKCPTSLDRVPSLSLEEAAPQTAQTQAADCKPEKTEETADNINKTVRLTAQSAQLIYTENTRFSFSINNGSVAGRQAEIDLSLLPRSEYISEKHCAFYHENGKWYVEDNNSTNGTFVNAKKLSPKTRQQICDGDSLTLANSTLTFKTKL